MNNHSTHLITGRSARAQIAQAIANAQKTIRLLAYAISPAPILDSTLQQSIFATLCAAPARGIICSAVIAQHPENSVHENNNTLAAIHLHDKGWQIHRYPCRPVMHAKLLIIDDHRIITGSHNMTTAALEHNRELSVITTQPDCVADALDFYTTLQDASAPHGKNHRPT